MVQSCHSRIADYAAPSTVDGVMFNFGWLPGGDHTVFSRADTSVAAVRAALPLLRPGGVMSLCLYYGRNNGTAERDALLQALGGRGSTGIHRAARRFLEPAGDVPIPVFILRE